MHDILPNLVSNLFPDSILFVLLLHEFLLFFFQDKKNISRVSMNLNCEYDSYYLSCIMHIK